MQWKATYLCAWLIFGILVLLAGVWSRLCYWWCGCCGSRSFPLKVLWWRVCELFDRVFQFQFQFWGWHHQLLSWTIVSTSILRLTSSAMKRYFGDVFVGYLSNYFNLNSDWHLQLLWISSEPKYIFLILDNFCHHWSSLPLWSKIRGTWKTIGRTYQRCNVICPHEIIRAEQIHSAFYIDKIRLADKRWHVCWWQL